MKQVVCRCGHPVTRGYVTEHGVRLIGRLELVYLNYRCPDCQKAGRRAIRVFHWGQYDLSPSLAEQQTAMQRKKET